MKKLLSVLMLVALVTAVSCKKDDPAPSRTAILTGTKWSATKATGKVGTNPEQDITSDFIQDCEKDDVYTFGTGGVYSNSVGADDCDGDSEPETGTWALTSNDTKFTVTVDQDPQEYTIVTLTSATFVISASQPEDLDGDGINETNLLITLTFTAKK